MIRSICAVTIALGLAACSEEAPPAETEAAAPKTLQAGAYEASWTVADVATTDGSDAPATELAAGATGTTSACVDAEGKLDPAIFAEQEGDECRATNSYIRNGRVSMQLECRRGGDQVMQTVTGKTTADGFEADVSSTAYLSQAGDYRLNRSFTARRVGECSALPAEGADNAAEGNGAQ